VTVAYAGNPDWGAGTGAGLWLTTGSPELSYVTVTESQTVGIRSRKTGSLSLDHITVTNCTSDGMIVVGNPGQTGTNAIANSTFSANGGYGINFGSQGRGSVTDTTITNNVSYAIGRQPHTEVLGLTGLVVSGNGSGTKNAINYRGGTISERDETWRASTIPYVVSSPTQVASGRILTIEAGTTAKFASNTSLKIYGKLSALGTITNPITLTTGADPDARFVAGR
jgi:hypothetical protein